MEGTDLGQMLDEVEVRGSHVDLGEVVREGLRIRRRRRFAEAVGVSALAMVVVAAITVPLALRSEGTSGAAGPAAATTNPGNACPATPLALPQGVKDYRTAAIDPTGRYVVADSGHSYADMFWDNGEPTAMNLPGMPNVLDVNSQGVALGETFLTGLSGGESVYLWKNGVTTILTYPMAGVWDPVSMGINSLGDVVATFEPADPPPNAVDAVVVLWKAGQTTGTKLPLKAGSSDAGITDARLIVVLVPRVGQPGPETEGVVVDYSGKIMRRLPLGLSIGATSATGSVALGTRQTAGDSGSTTFSWDLRTGAITDLSADITNSWTINAHNWVLTHDGTVYAGNRTFRLAPLRAHEKPDLGRGSISDNGIVLGQSFDGSHAAVPTEWHC